MILKFRAWDTHGQKMFSNNELIIWGGNVYLDESKGLPCRNLKCRSIPDEHLMQSTGLKDKNGQEIFEGDILGTKDGLLNGVVEYRTDLGMWTNSLIRYNNRYNNFERLCNVDNSREIIGNIYENPELLEIKGE